MPCPHKFQQYLNLEGLDFEPTTLIVGTFNPAWPDDNAAEWFYGRTGNNYFWDVLPSLYGVGNLRNATPHDWKTFCHDYGIAITDLIACINDADNNNPEHHTLMGGFLDNAIANNFHDFTPVDIANILETNPTIQHVYLTRQINGGFWNGYWQKVVDACQAHGKPEPKQLITPSKQARFQMGDYVLNHPDDPTPLRTFIFEKWSAAWHQI